MKLKLSRKLTKWGMIALTISLIGIISFWPKNDVTIEHVGWHNINNSSNYLHNYKLSLIRHGVINENLDIQLPIFEKINFVTEGYFLDGTTDTKPHSGTVSWFPSPI